MKGIVVIIFILTILDLGLALKCYTCEVTKKTKDVTTCEAPSRNPLEIPTQTCPSTENAVCVYYTLYSNGNIETFHRDACKTTKHCEMLKQLNGENLKNCETCSKDLCGEKSGSNKQKVEFLLFIVVWAVAGLNKI